MLTAETHRGVLAASVEAGAAGWLGKDVFLDDFEAALDDVLAGTPLIGGAHREAMIDELRIERAGRRRALEPFEQLTLREREVLAALVDGLSAEEIAETQFVALGDGALADPRGAAEARRALTAGRRGPRQPRGLVAGGAPPLRGLTWRTAPTGYVRTPAVGRCRRPRRPVLGRPDGTATEVGRGAG